MGVRLETYTEVVQKYLEKILAQHLFTKIYKTSAKRETRGLLQEHQMILPASRRQLLIGRFAEKSYSIIWISNGSYC